MGRRRTEAGVACGGWEVVKGYGVKEFVVFGSDFIDETIGDVVKVQFVLGCYGWPPFGECGCIRELVICHLSNLL